MDDAGGAGVWTVMAGRAEGMGGQVVHMVTPGLDVADRAVRWRIAERVVARTLDGMGQHCRID